MSCWTRRKNRCCVRPVGPLYIRTSSPTQHDQADADWMRQSVCSSAARRAGRRWTQCFCLRTFKRQCCLCYFVIKWELFLWFCVVREALARVRTVRVQVLPQKPQNLFRRPKRKHVNLNGVQKAVLRTSRQTWFWHILSDHLDVSKAFGSSGQFQSFILFSCYHG